MDTSLSGIDRPPLPPDISRNFIDRYLNRGSDFRHQRHHFFGGRMSLRNLVESQAALLALCTEEQKKTLMHYGYIEEKGQTTGRTYRIHWDFGNNVSMFITRFYAERGLDCHIYGDDTNEQIISNLLAIRTTEGDFLGKACSVIPFEANPGMGGDPDYMTRNRARATFPVPEPVRPEIAFSDRNSPPVVSQPVRPNWRLIPMF